MPAEFTELAGHDAYELLGVSPDASQEEIRRRYRTLVKATHPDLFSERQAKAEADQRIRLLNAAREILHNRRAAYDAVRSAPADEEIEDAEIIDDPWATAESGTPPPADPWDTADSGRPPPPQHAQPPRTHPPMPPPPRYGDSPGARFHPPPAPLRRRRLTAWKIGLGCSVVWCLVLFAGVISMVRSALSPSDTGPKPSASVPAPLAGTWEGMVKDAGKQKGKKSGWKAALTLRTGKHNGEVRYLDGKCTGTAVPVSYQGNRLTVDTVFEMSGCDVGDIQVTRRKDGRLHIAYHDKNGKVTSSGVLILQR
jgi:hypothetical protein